MSTALMSKEHAIPVRSAAKVDMKLEVVVIPVSDVERAKQFYLSIGWRLDGDFAHGDWHLVQMTPRGSPCSFFLGKGTTGAAPGSAPGLILAVDDVQAARAELIEAGVEVSEAFHFEGDRLHFAGTQGRLPGPDPERRSYFSFAEFSDPDGNGWLLQEITTRFPGRGLSSLDIPTLVPLLRETEQQHGKYEATAPKHHWSDWYAAYLVARERGRTPDEAAQDAALHMQHP
jgi:catechol 2,3-dioxygenase-like lactoylglutathione lyase family enzyme